MAIGTYTLPICDLCKLPWLPVGWKQDTDPRAPNGKPLRCGKCKSIGWDREYVKADKSGNVAQTDRAPTASDAPEVIPSVATQVEEVAGATPAVPTSSKSVKTQRCKHRMTNCPVCHPKEVA